MKYDKQINAVVNSIFLLLKLLAKVKSFLAFSEFERVIHAFISSRLDLQSPQITLLRTQKEELEFLT